MRGVRLSGTVTLHLDGCRACARAHRSIRRRRRVAMLIPFGLIWRTAGMRDKLRDLIAFNPMWEAQATAAKMCTAACLTAVGTGAVAAPTVTVAVPLVVKTATPTPMAAQVVPAKQQKKRPKPKPTPTATVTPAARDAHVDADRDADRDGRGEAERRRRSCRASPWPGAGESAPTVVKPTPTPTRSRRPWRHRRRSLPRRRRRPSRRRSRRPPVSFRRSRRFIAMAAMSIDETTFNAALDRHRRELHVHCYRMLGSFDEAEDALQDAFLRAWKARESFAGGEGLRAWLYKIATNVCLDSLRAKQRRPPDAGRGPVAAALPGPAARRGRADRGGAGRRRRRARDDRADLHRRDPAPAGAPARGAGAARRAGVVGGRDGGDARPQRRRRPTARCSAPGRR